MASALPSFPSGIVSARGCYAHLRHRSVTRCRCEVASALQCFPNGIVSARTCSILSGPADQCDEGPRAVDEERAIALDLMNEIHRIPMHKIGFLQTSVSAKFRDGSSLEECVCQIDSGDLDPSAHPNFVLNLVRASRSDLYWTLDHRRLLAMQIAGCKMARVGDVGRQGEVLWKAIALGMTRGLLCVPRDELVCRRAKEPVESQEPEGKT